MDEELERGQSRRIIFLWSLAIQWLISSPTVPSQISLEVQMLLLVSPLLHCSVALLLFSSSARLLMEPGVWGLYGYRIGHVVGQKATFEHENRNARSHLGPWVSRLRGGAFVGELPSSTQYFPVSCLLPISLCDTLSLVSATRGKWPGCQEARSQHRIQIEDLAIRLSPIFILLPLSIHLMFSSPYKLYI